MSDRFDDPEDDDEYFAEVDEGEDTGKSPKFVALPDLAKQPAELNEMRVDELLAMTIRLRNQLSTDRKGWKLREAKVKAQITTIGSVMLNRCTQLGVDSFRTEAGSGYRSQTERFKVAPDGWSDLTNYILESGNFHLLQKRVSSDAVREIRAAEGQVPPGVEVTPIEQFVVRSPTARRS